MLDLRKIRAQMMFGVIMMLIIVGMLSFASFQGVAKFRELTKSVRDRTMELPEAAELGNQVSRLRSLLSQMNHQSPELAQPSRSIAVLAKVNGR